MFVRLLAVVMAFVLPAACTAQSGQTTLYDSTGNPVAYIADDLTIYLWSGKPVAYLYNGSRGTDVYGFNGKHIGWFEKGYISDNDGKAACGLKSVTRSAKSEPIKSLQGIKPIKSIRELPPIKPMTSTSWSATPCRIALGLGS